MPAAKSASTKKKTTSSAAKKKSTASKKAPPKQPRRREIGAVVCLVLAVCSFLGYFSSDGWFIAFFRNVLGGLFGKGFYLVPPALICCAVILFTHRGRPVRLRVFAALMIPVLFGALLHLFVSEGPYTWGGGLLGKLYADGPKLGPAGSGGAVSGLVAMAFIAVFGRVGTGIVLIVLLLAALLLVSNVTVSSILQHVRERERVEYEYVPKPEKPKKEKVYTEPQTPVHSMEQPRPAAKKRKIDFPVDEPTYPDYAEEGTVVQPSKKSAKKEKGSFFDRQPGVPTPDELLYVDAPKAEPQVTIQPSLTATRPPITPMPAADSAGRGASAAAVAAARTAGSFTSAGRSNTARPAPKAASTARRPQSAELSPEPEQPEPFDEMPAAQPVEQPKPAPKEAPAPQPVHQSDKAPVGEMTPLEQEYAAGKKAEKLRNEAEVAAASQEIAQQIGQSMAEAAPPEYVYPPTELLAPASGSNGAEGMAEVQMNAQRLENTIRSFGIAATLRDVTRGPSVTRYEVELEQGVKLSRLTNLSDDIALALGATGVRIAPIPNKISIVGIEVPNKVTTVVALREIIESSEFEKKSSKLSFAVGKDIAGKPIVGDIAKLPHMLIAGTTGSGKSVCMNSLILSLLFKATPEEVRLIMVDPKMIELGVYNGIPHLLIPVVTDPKKAAGALQWAVVEMMKRYSLFAEVGARDLATYNNLILKQEGGQRLPQIVVLIDELADLMMIAAKDVEESICRVAQMGRASGIHLVIATQRPSADVITGLMKANIPSRIAFAVDSALNSRIILDTTGAEKLVGKGDMLYFPLGSGKPLRVQGTFVTDEEREDIVNFVKEHSEANYSEDINKQIELNAEKSGKDGKEKKEPELPPEPADGDELDEMFDAAVDVILESKQASVSMLQRRLKLGYSRAARLVDQMEQKGIVGPFEGSKPRQILITREQWNEMKGIEPNEFMPLPEEDYTPEPDEDEAGE